MKNWLVYSDIGTYNWNYCPPAYDKEKLSYQKYILRQNEEYKEVIHLKLQYNF